MNLGLISSVKFAFFNVEETLLSVLLPSPVDPAVTKQSEGKRTVAFSNHERAQMPGGAHSDGRVPNILRCSFLTACFIC